MFAGSAVPVQTQICTVEIGISYVTKRNFVDSVVVPIVLGGNTLVQIKPRFIR